MANTQSPATAQSLHSAQVITNEQVASSIFCMVIKAPKLAAAILPGQFMNFEVPGNAAHILRVPLSFSRADAAQGTIELVYAVMGDATRRLSNLAAGQTMSVVGPLGHGWKLPQNQELPALLIAGGVGAPPIVAAAQMLSNNGLTCEVILGAQSSSRLWDPVWLHELPGVRAVHIATDDGSAGFHGFTTQLAHKLVQASSAADKNAGAAGFSAPAFGSLYTCGPAPMMAGVAQVAEEFGIPCQASLEARMSCGFGACNTCNIPMRKGGYKSCCMDGPVMDALEVRWA